MIKQLKMVVEELEAEVYSDPTSDIEDNGKRITYADQEEM